MYIYLCKQREKDDNLLIWILIHQHWNTFKSQSNILKVNLCVQLLMFVQPHFFDFHPLLISSSLPSRPALLIRLLPLASSLLPPSSTLPPLPPPQGLSGYHASLIQTSWGFFHRANYRQLGAQRITFSVQGKAEARGERIVLWNTQILDWEGREVCLCVCVCLCCIRCICTCVD